MPAVEYKDIVNQIIVRLSQIPNIGCVHNYQRNLNTDEDVYAEFYDQNLKRVNAWTVSREAFSDTQGTNIENIKRSVLVLRGYMAVEDKKTTELLFQKVIDDISAAFRPQDNLGETVELIEPIQARNIGYTMLGNSIQCHAAELTLLVQEFYQN